MSVFMNKNGTFCTPYELVEVAEGVKSLQIALGQIQIVFFSKIVQKTYFILSLLVKDSLLDLHLEVDFEGVVEVLGVEIMS